MKKIRYLLLFVLAPFSEVHRNGPFIIISFVSNAAIPVLAILMLLEAAALFVLTFKLLERKVNL